MIILEKPGQEVCGVSGELSWARSDFHEEL